MTTRYPFIDPIEAPDLATKIVAKDGNDAAGFVTVEQLGEVVVGSIIPAKSMGVAGDGITNDTLAVQTWLARGISTGKVLTLHGPARITTDFTLTGGSTNDRLRVLGYGPAAFVADGASRITLRGTWGSIEFEDIDFRDFTHSPFWLAGGINLGEEPCQVGELRFHNCKSIDNLLFLSAQGNTAQAGYTTAVTFLPNASTTISSLRVTGCAISGGRAGIVLPVVVETAHVEGNSITGLANSTTTGSALEHSVTGIQIGPLGGNLAQGDFIGDASDHSPDFDRMKAITVINNKLDGLVQNDQTKGCMGIGVNGFGCVVSGNQLRNITSPTASDTADADNNDNEGIYTKAANVTISNNTFHNCASTEALINIKGSSFGRVSYAGGGEQPGFQNVVSGNSAYWDITPNQGITFCAIYGAPCTIVGNSAIGLGNASASVTNVAFDIQGEFSAAGINQGPIIIDCNYMQGSFDYFVRHRGGIDGLTIGPGNVANITGGDGTCGYYLMSQGSSGTEVRNVKVAGLFRIRDRDNSVLANCHAVVTTGTMNFPVRNMIVENLVLDVSDASNSNIQYRLLTFSVTGTPYYKGMVFRDITFPPGLAGNQIIELPNANFEYEFDNVIEYTTPNATMVPLYDVRVAQHHCLTASIVAFAYDAVAFDRAMYHQDSVSSRASGTGNLAVTANTLGTPIEVSDTSWTIASTFSTSFFQFQIVGDATNPTQWKVHVKAMQIGALT